MLREETERLLQQVQERVQKEKEERERLAEVEGKKANDEEYERISVKYICDVLEL